MRVWYTRKGPVKYLSHLDTNRTMQRALARSHLPVWYTQGFNPHIYLTFALPTPLGYESLCESLDFRLVQDISNDEVLSRLNACLPSGLRAIRAEAPVQKPEEITSAEYEVSLSAPGKGAGELSALLGAFLAREEILAEKKTKKGLKQIDLKPFVSVQEQAAAADDSVRTVLRLAAGATQNINPTLLFDAFSAWAGLELDCIRVCKRQIFAQSGDVEAPFA